MGRTASPAWTEKEPEIILKGPDELARMKAAGRVVARALNAMRDAIVPGSGIGPMRSR